MTAEDVIKILDPIAKGLGVAVNEVWKIFTRQYLVIGVSEVFTGIVLAGAAWGLSFLTAKSLWFIFIPIVLGGLSLYYIYSAIPLLFNPQYRAMNEIIEKIKDFKKNSDDE